MHRPSFDLGYTHEIPAVAPYAPAQAVLPARRASDLTSRLRCLKTLHDVERDGVLGPCGLASRLQPVRRRPMQ